MKHAMRIMLLMVALPLFCLPLSGCPNGNNSKDKWTWKRHEKILEIGYRKSASEWPQMAAIHLDTGALRMVYGPDSGWGPTVYIPPSLWTVEYGSEKHHLGAPVSATVNTVGDELLVEFDGTIGGLKFVSHIWFSPPANDRFEAFATVWTSGDVKLADRSEEAFKPVHVASMFISDAEWDSHAIRIDAHEYSIPLSGWILPEPKTLGDAFTLVGGSSAWKSNSPNITVILDRSMNLQGWADESTDPNDDNVGFWCATDTVLNFWEYRIIATQEPIKGAHSLSPLP